jgi:hypothetical protein
MLVPVSVPERAFDAPIGTWATEKTHPLIVPVVPGSLSASRSPPGRLLSKIELADVADRLASTRRHRTQRHARSNSTLQAADMHQRTDLYHPAEPSRRAASSNLEH